MQRDGAGRPVKASRCLSAGVIWERVLTAASRAERSSMATSPNCRKANPGYRCLGWRVVLTGDCRTWERDQGNGGYDDVRPAARKGRVLHGRELGWGRGKERSSLSVPKNL